MDPNDIALLVSDPNDQIGGRPVTFPPNADALIVYRKGDELDGRILVRAIDGRVTRIQVPVEQPPVPWRSLLKKDYQKGNSLQRDYYIDKTNDIIKYHEALMTMTAGIIIGFNLGMTTNFSGDHYEGDKRMSNDPLRLDPSSMRKHLSVAVTSLHAVIEHNVRLAGTKVFEIHGNRAFQFLAPDTFHNPTVNSVHFKAMSYYQQCSVVSGHCICYNKSKYDVLTALIDPNEQNIHRATIQYRRAGHVPAD